MLHDEERRPLAGAPHDVPVAGWQVDDQIIAQGPRSFNARPALTLGVKR